MVLVDFESGKIPFSFFNKTILLAAIALATFRCSGLFKAFCSRSSLLNLKGSSNNPNSNFFRNIRFTASSIKAIGTFFSFTNCAK